MIFVLERFFVDLHGSHSNDNVGPQSRGNSKLRYVYVHLFTVAITSEELHVIADKVNVKKSAEKKCASSATPNLKKSYSKSARIAKCKTYRHTFEESADHEDAYELKSDSLQSLGTAESPNRFLSRSEEKLVMDAGIWTQLTKDDWTAIEIIEHSKRIDLEALD